MIKKPRRAPSGRLLLRLPPAIHRMVQRSAAATGLSVNEYCVRRLAAPGPTLTLDGPWSDLMTRADAMFGPAVAGIITHGSWARGDAADESDIDALIVVDRSVPLVRNIYRAWDSQVVTWGGRPVDVHFVHLPEPDAVTASALWCEAALDGVVLFERDRSVSHALGRLRHGIASGRFIRRLVHGQPYWIEAA